MHTFVELPHFARMRAGLMSDEELSALQGELLRNPAVGDVVPGTGGVRKLRWSRPGMGKRGGMRVLYYVQDARGRIWLLTVYAKNATGASVAMLRLYREEADNAEIE